MSNADLIARAWRSPPNADTPPSLRETYLGSLGLLPRQLRLFGVGCWRSPPILERRRRNPNNINPLSRLMDAIDLAERLIDGEAVQGEIDRKFSNPPFGFSEDVLLAAVDPVPIDGAVMAYESAYNQKARYYYDHEWVYQGVLLVGIVAPGWECLPEWKTSTTSEIARTIYNHHDFSLMPILADALEETGCTNREWLSLLRGVRSPGNSFLRGHTVGFLEGREPWPWCRGCKIIDDLR